jgi:hemerythrin-like domain-containing protein
MNAFEQLIEEHRLIAQVLDAFEQYVTRVASGEALERADLERFVLFFREYVDLGHHDKEETILMPALVHNGFHWDDGPVLKMRTDHDQERYLQRSLRDAALQIGDWSDEGRRRFVAMARELIEFQRAHIALEERTIFPEARRRIPARVAEQIGHEFARLDSIRVGDATKASLGALAKTLVAAYPTTG